MWSPKKSRSLRKFHQISWIAPASILLDPKFFSLWFPGIELQENDFASEKSEVSEILFNSVRASVCQVLARTWNFAPGCDNEPQELADTNSSFSFKQENQPW